MQGYSLRLVFVVTTLLSIDPAERRSAAELLEFLSDDSNPFEY